MQPVGESRIRAKLHRALAIAQYSLFTIQDARRAQTLLSGHREQRNENDAKGFGKNKEFVVARYLAYFWRCGSGLQLGWQSAAAAVRSDCVANLLGTAARESRPRLE